MNSFLWLHIFAAYTVYIVVAIATSIVVRKTNGNLKDLNARNSPRMLLFGGAANLIAMAGIICLMVFWDNKSIASLGIALHPSDIVAGFGGLGVTIFMSIGFLVILHHLKLIESLELVKPVRSVGEIQNTLIGLVVLVTIVLQEEVLNRGYVTLNVHSFDPIVIILVSITFFVLIHFITNRSSIYQVVSWAASGFVLIISYLMSGSIWVPVALHYGIDATNTFVFNITGRFSFFKISPAMTEAQRAVFRLIHSCAIVIFLIIIYGLKFRFVSHGLKLP